MAKGNPLVQFRLDQEAYEALVAAAMEGESPAQAARRLVVEALARPMRLGSYGERVTAERELTVEDQQMVAKLVKGAAKKPTTTIEQERAQAAERMRAALRPKYDNGISGGWPPEMRSQDEIDFDDVPVIGAPPPELPEELPKKGRK